MSDVKKLYRSRTDRMIGGVCGGLGNYLHIDSTVIRLLFVLATVATGVGMGVIAYIVLLVVVPEEPITAPTPPATTNEPI